MKRIMIFIAMALVMSVASMASAVTYNLYDNVYNRDGSISKPFGSSPFDFGGLSTGVDITSSGSHSIVLLMDAEIDQDINTFFNEIGSANGPLAAGQSWQIGDPLFTNIYDLVNAGALTNSDLNGGEPNDVALALGWNFFLDTGKKANVSFLLTDVLPDSGFYLAQYDPDSQATLYFSSKLKIEDNGGGNPSVPEPSTFALLGSALVCFGFYARKRRNG